AERVFVSCGMYESLIYENRSLVPLLQSSGMDVRYVEARDGHNWENWRDRLREGLSWLFPGPLLLVYEKGAARRSSRSRTGSYRVSPSMVTASRVLNHRAAAISCSLAM